MTKEYKSWGLALWIVKTDGSSKQHVGGIGVVLQSLEGEVIECVVQLQFPMINNEAGYKAFLIGIDLTKAAGASSKIIHSDSQVIVEHVNNDYKSKSEQMKKIPKSGEV